MEHERVFDREPDDLTEEQLGWEIDRLSRLVEDMEATTHDLHRLRRCQTLHGALRNARTSAPRWKTGETT